MRIGRAERDGCGSASAGLITRYVATIASGDSAMPSSTHAFVASTPGSVHCLPNASTAAPRTAKTTPRTTCARVGTQIASAGYVATRNAVTRANVTADAETPVVADVGRIATYPAAVSAATISAASVASSRRSPNGTWLRISLPNPATSVTRGRRNSRSSNPGTSGPRTKTSAITAAPIRKVNPTARALLATAPSRSDRSTTPLMNHATAAIRFTTKERRSGASGAAR